MAARMPSQNERRSGTICIGKLQRMSGVTWWASQTKKSGSATSSRKQRLNFGGKTVNAQTSSNARCAANLSTSWPTAVQTLVQRDRHEQVEPIQEHRCQTQLSSVPLESTGTPSPKTSQSPSSSASTALPSTTDLPGHSNKHCCQIDNPKNKTEPSWSSALSEVTTLRQTDTWFDDSEEPEEPIAQTPEQQSPISRTLSQQDDPQPLTKCPHPEHPPPSVPLPHDPNLLSLLSLERKTSTKLDHFTRSQRRQDIRLRDVESNTAGLIRRAADQGKVVRDQFEIIDQLQTSCDVQISSIANLQEQLEVVNQSQRMTEFALYASEERCKDLERRVKGLEELILRKLGDS